MIRHVLIPAALAALVSAPAAAYVIGGHSVLRLFAETEAATYAAASPLVGTARLPGSDDDWPVRIDLTRGGCRAQLHTPQGDALVSMSAGRVSAQGASLPALEAFAALACPLLMRNVPADEAESAARQHAARLGIDVGVSALSLVDGRVGWIVGAGPHDRTRPQLWLDKETDRPLRIIASHASRLWDIHLLQGDSIATNRLAPRLVSVWLDGERALDLRLMAQTPRLSGRETPSEIPEGDDE